MVQKWCYQENIGEWFIISLAYFLSEEPLVLQFWVSNKHLEITRLKKISASSRMEKKWLLKIFITFSLYLMHTYEHFQLPNQSLNCSRNYFSLSLSNVYCLPHLPSLLLLRMKPGYSIWLLVGSLLRQVVSRKEGSKKKTEGRIRLHIKGITTWSGYRQTMETYCFGGVCCSRFN